MIYSVLFGEDMAYFLLMSFLCDNSVKCCVTEGFIPKTRQKCLPAYKMKIIVINEWYCVYKDY